MLESRNHKQWFSCCLCFMFYPWLGPCLLADLSLSLFSHGPSTYLNSSFPSSWGHQPFWAMIHLLLPLCRLLTSNGLILRYCGLGLNLWSLSRHYSVYKKIISEEVTSVSLLGHLWGRHIFEFSWWKLSRYWVLRLKLASRYWGNTVLWHKNSSLMNHSRSGLAFGSWG